MTGCADLELLERWLDRAFAASAADELFVDEGEDADGAEDSGEAEQAVCRADANGMGHAEIVATVPDLICVLDTDTGEPVSAEGWGTAYG